jgi:glutathione S-transferase
MTELRVYGYPVSTFTRTATMACSEKGVAYELVPIAYGTDEHTAKNPFGRIPVLEHGDTVIFETLAITGYIDEAFEGPPLQPEALLDRMRMRQWISLCADHVYRDLVRGLPRGRTATAAERDAAERVLANVEAMVTTPFLAGPALSLADLYLAPQISGALEKAPDIFDPLPALREWFGHISTRESFLSTGYDPSRLS